MKSTEKKNYNKKSGVKAVVITLAVIFLLIVVGIVTLIFGFPKTMGDICYSLGFDAYASKLYNTSYERSGDINTLYSSLNCAIKSGKSDLIVSQFEKIYENKEYIEFVAFIDSENAKIEESAIIKASLLNEDNYLKNQYVIALIKEEKAEKAFNFAVADGLKEIITFNNIGNYLFGNFAGQSAEFLTEKVFSLYGEQEETIEAQIIRYLNRLHLEFKNNYSTISDEYIISMGNRLIYVGESLNIMREKANLEPNEDIQKIVKEAKENLASRLMA